MLPVPKPPPKPRKSKYESISQHQERVKEWEATLPPPIEGEPGGHHMAQEYYTKTLLPEYIQTLHSSRIYSPVQTEWRLQEDGDPSHGKRSTDNVAENLRRANEIVVI
ncbi:hypothetical protein GQ44DRAFT_776417 [Phaeosphaeriaceae sp. PMI808]|nr:hypothetical protein GQ44DRAFT_776417 [Phaeosphaeriaceae sp. PMI808]